VKMTAFCDIAPCSLVEADGRFRDVYCLHYHDDGDITCLCNVGLLQQDYTALYPRSLSSFDPALCIYGFGMILSENFKY
jgi:hypothetical protein